MRNTEIESWVGDVAGHTKPAAIHNVRVLQWIIDRVEGRAAARSAAIGNLPTDLDLSGLDVSPAPLEALLAVDPQAWLAEVEQNEAFLSKFGDRIPTPSWTSIGRSAIAFAHPSPEREAPARCLH